MANENGSPLKDVKKIIALSEDAVKAWKQVKYDLNPALLAERISEIKTYAKYVEFVLEKNDEENLTSIAKDWEETGKVLYPKTNSWGCVEHAKLELEEIQEELVNGKDPQKLATEYADVLLCLITGIGKSGITMMDVIGALRRKIEINKGREWIEVNGEHGIYYIHKK